jgi:deoxyribonuclease IV
VLYGAHVSTAGGILTAIERARDDGCDAVQIFTQSSRQWRPTNHPPADLSAFGPAAAEVGIGYAVCHAIYFINLATADEVVYPKSVAALEQTTAVAAAIGADVVFHVGSHRGDGLAAAMPRIQDGLAGALELLGEDRWMLLENSAGAGDTIGRDVAELAEVIQAAGHPRLGICIDTCHAYVSGVDLTDPDEVERFLASIDGLVGLERLRALHVNDAAAPLGSNRDRHACMLEGAMGERLGVFLAHPALQDLPAILETPGADRTYAEQIRLLKRIHELGLVERA